MNYSKFARVFEGDIWATKVETQDDFDKALRVTQIMNKLCYIEICVEPDDVPDLSKEMIASFKQENNEKVQPVLEEYSSKKLELSLDKNIINFTTKIHESLK